MDREVVWLNEYLRFAWLIRRDAFFSLVDIPEIGQEWVSNDDYDLWEERTFDYESDDGE